MVQTRGSRKALAEEDQSPLRAMEMMPKSRQKVSRAPKKIKKVADDRVTKKKPASKRVTRRRGRSKSVAEDEADSMEEDDPDEVMSTEGDTEEDEAEPALEASGAADVEMEDSGSDPDEVPVAGTSEGEVHVVVEHEELVQDVPSQDTIEDAAPSQELATITYGPVTAVSEDAGLSKVPASGPVTAVCEDAAPSEELATIDTTPDGPVTAVSEDAGPSQVPATTTHGPATAVDEDAAPSQELAHTPRGPVTAASEDAGPSKVPADDPVTVVTTTTPPSASAHAPADSEDASPSFVDAPENVVLSPPQATTTQQTDDADLIPAERERHSSFCAFLLSACEMGVTEFVVDAVHTNGVTVHARYRLDREEAELLIKSTGRKMETDVQEERRVALAPVEQSVAEPVEAAPAEEKEKPSGSWLRRGLARVAGSVNPLGWLTPRQARRPIPQFGSAAGAERARPPLFEATGTVLNSPTPTARPRRVPSSDTRARTFAGKSLGLHHQKGTRSERARARQLQDLVSQREANLVAGKEAEKEVGREGELLPEEASAGGQQTPLTRKRKATPASTGGRSRYAYDDASSDSSPASAKLGETGFLSEVMRGLHPPPSPSYRPWLAPYDEFVRYTGRNVLPETSPSKRMRVGGRRSVAWKAQLEEDSPLEKHEPTRSVKYVPDEPYEVGSMWKEDLQQWEPTSKDPRSTAGHTPARTPTRNFTVPWDSDSDDEEELPETGSRTGESSTLGEAERLNKVRERAAAHSPRTPSRLRESETVTISSRLGDNPKILEVVEELIVDLELWGYDIPVGRLVKAILDGDNVDDEVIDTICGEPNATAKENSPQCGHSSQTEAGQQSPLAAARLHPGQIPDVPTFESMAAQLGLDPVVVASVDELWQQDDSPFGHILRDMDVDPDVISSVNRTYEQRV